MTPLHFQSLTRCLKPPTQELLQLHLYACTLSNKMYSLLKIAELDIQSVCMDMISTLLLSVLSVPGECLSGMVIQASQLFRQRDPALPSTWKRVDSVLEQMGQCFFRHCCLYQGQDWHQLRKPAAYEDRLLLFCDRWQTSAANNKVSSTKH